MFHAKSWHRPNLCTFYYCCGIKLNAIWMMIKDKVWEVRAITTAQHNYTIYNHIRRREK